MNQTIESQFQNLGIVRAASLGVVGHALTEDDDAFRRQCGYGLGDASGNLFGRFADHLSEASDR